jgi:hypothetical protein
MFAHLDALRAVLDGDAAKAMDGMLARLEPLRKEWQGSATRPVGAPATKPATAPATQPATSRAAELTEEEARVLAARLVNEYLAGKEFKVDVDVGGIVPKPTWTKERWDNVVKRDGRWHLTWGKPAGWSASVSFQLDGSDAKVEVDFAAD